MTTDDDERRAIRTAATRWLSFHGERTMRERLTQLAALPEADGHQDLYGVGDPVAGLERRTAELLGKPAARYVIKGTIAQQAALRTWTDTTGTRSVALHRLSHLDLDEGNALERLHPIAAIRLGTTEPFTVDDLDKTTEPIGAVTVELPLRRAGFALLDWDQLTAISLWCRQRHIPLHLDGARLWESAPFYGRPLAEIAALADSVYVSFYKGLDGMAGCALAGPEDFLARATPWLSRHGANVYTVFPYALAAAHGLDVHLPRMPEYAARARTLSAALRAIPGVHGREPRTNSFAVHLPGDATALDLAHRALARRTRTWLVNAFAASAVPGLTTVEVQVGAAAAHIPDGEAADLVAELMADAGAAAE